eukprot:518891-Prorocentrum_minimum.AAC.2
MPSHAFSISPISFAALGAGGPPSAGSLRSDVVFALSSGANDSLALYTARRRFCTNLLVLLLTRSCCLRSAGVSPFPEPNETSGLLASCELGVVRDCVRESAGLDPALLDHTLVVGVAVGVVNEVVGEVEVLTLETLRELDEAAPVLLFVILLRNEL